MIASRTLHPRTRPVAFRRKSVGASDPADFPPTPSESSLIDILPLVLDDALSAVDEDVPRHLLLLLVEIDDGALQDAVGVDTARVDRQGPTDLGDALGLVNMAVDREHRLARRDGVAPRGRSDGLHHP